MRRHHNFRRLVVPFLVFLTRANTALHVPFRSVTTIYSFAPPPHATSYASARKRSRCWSISKLGKKPSHSTDSGSVTDSPHDTTPSIAIPVDEDINSYRAQISELIALGAQKVTGVEGPIRAPLKIKEEEMAEQESTNAPGHKFNINILRNMLRRYVPGCSRPSKDSVGQSREWRRLQKHVKHMSTLHLRTLMMDSKRCEKLTAMTDGIILDYSRQQVTTGTMNLLLDLAKRQKLEEKIQAMRRGDKINLTEKRSVLHTACRASPKESIIVDGVDVIDQVHTQLRRIHDFSEGVRQGYIVGSTGRPIKNMISVGIGGSFLGPSFISEVLATEREGIFSSQGFVLRFLSNVDSVDFARCVDGLDAEETMVVVVSKTMTTSETMLNARTMRQWLWDRMSDGEPDPEITRLHMVCCASESAGDKVAAFGIMDDYFFNFWDWVGGRFSVTSSVGVLPLSFKYGYTLVRKMLLGARAMDDHLFYTPLDKNLPVIMGLLGVWNLSFLGYKARTMLPYSEALCKFPAHVQQVDMESNGKAVSLTGEILDYAVGEVDFGESGTNSQHSFFQLLHMGQPVPCDFIGFMECQNDLVHTEGETLSSHDELMANFFAQPDALAMGRSAEELLKMEPGLDPALIPHRVFPGNRPSLSLLLPQLSAYSAGQMLALYEHRTMVQGFIWDLNSFDQYGVEFGKTLASSIREQLWGARKQLIPVQGLNPSTDRLMNHYLKGVGGYDTQWDNAPRSLRQKIRRLNETSYGEESFYAGPRKYHRSTDVTPGQEMLDHEEQAEELGANEWPYL